VNPMTKLIVAGRAARRRRYGYAALRVLRRGLGRALVAHLERSIGPKPYASQLEAIRRRYRHELLWLLRRFPSLDMADPRGVP